MDRLVDFMEQQCIHYNAQVNNCQNIHQPQYPRCDYRQSFPRYNNCHQPSSWSRGNSYQGCNFSPGRGSTPAG